MQFSPTVQQSDVGRVARLRRRAALPAWAVSAILHLTLLLIVAVVAGQAPSGANVEPSRQAGIVLVAQYDDRREYFDGSDDGSDESESIADQATDFGEMAAATPGVDEAPLDPADLLPDAPRLGAEGLHDGIADAGRATDGTAASRKIEGRARVEVFGIEGEGYKFVYVFDRSGSMSEPGGRPMAVAKAELIRSLDSLESTHQFQIIFYNHEPRRFNPGGQSRLGFADEANKDMARRFVQQITASGGTDPEPALAMAIRMRPDVVFFLTDGDDITLAALDRITRLNRGASIHVIEFGPGSSTGTPTARELARRNNGRFTYVDVGSF